MFKLLPARVDRLGQEVDASAAKENEICVSLPRLAGKLSKQNYKEQIARLLAHEIAHLLGVEDEAEAQSLEPLLPYWNVASVLEFYNRKILHEEILGKSIPVMKKAIDAGDYSLAYMHSRSFFSRFMNPGNTGVVPFRISNRLRADHVFDLGEALDALGFAISLQICAMNPGNEGHAKECRKLLDSAMQDQESVPAYEFYNRLAKPASEVDFARPSNWEVSIDRAQTVDALKNQIVDLEEWLRNFQIVINATLGEEIFPVDVK